MRATLYVAVGIIIGVMMMLAIQYSPTIFNSIAENLNSESLEDSKSISGDFGDLTVISDGYSKSLFANKFKLEENDQVGLESVYPDRKHPELIIAWSDCGGSACGREHAIIIDPKITPIYSESIPELLAKNVSVKRLGSDQYLLSGTSTFVTNKLGDLISISLRYDRKKKRLDFVPVGLDYSPYVGKHPDVLLCNDNARSIFLTQMSPEEFKDFRNDMSVSGGVSAQNLGRFVFAEGMAAHMGGDPSAFFAIDNLTENFLVGIYEGGTVKLIKSSKDIRGFDKFLSDFLDNHNMRWDYRINQAVLKQ